MPGDVTPFRCARLYSFSAVTPHNLHRMIDEAIVFVSLSWLHVARMCIHLHPSVAQESLLAIAQMAILLAPHKHFQRIIAEYANSGALINHNTTATKLCGASI